MLCVPYFAEGERFELSVPCDTHAFQACALDHYANPPILRSIPARGGQAKRAGAFAPAIIFVTEPCRRFPHTAQQATRLYILLYPTSGVLASRGYDGSAV